MPSASQRQAAQKRVEAAIAAGRAMENGVWTRDHAADLAVSFDFMPRDVFASWMQANEREAMTRLAHHMGAVGAATPATPQPAASGPQGRAGTATPPPVTTSAGPVYPPSWTPSRSVTEPNGVRVGASGGPRIAGEGISAKQAATPMGAAPSTGPTTAQRIEAARADAQAVMAAAQASTTNRFHRPSVTGPSGAAEQQARHDAGVQAMYARQRARVAGAVA